MLGNTFTQLHSAIRGSPLDPNLNPSPLQQQQPPPAKKKRSLPGTPDPEAEVIALSPCTLMAKNRFICEICNKGFQRDQNLQLHRRGHNLPWKLKQRSGTDQPRKRVYVCPEPSCIHHDPARALGDLTGVKKHFSRKHGEKRWKCDKCSKRYAVQSDWKAHCKTCGSREYKCDCGTIFSRKDSFITHRAFCDALTRDSIINCIDQNYASEDPPHLDTSMLDHHNANLSFFLNQRLAVAKFPSLPPDTSAFASSPSAYSRASTAGLFSSGEDQTLASLYTSNNNKINMSAAPLLASHSSMSATALLQRAAQMGATMSNTLSSSSWGLMSSARPDQKPTESFRGLLTSAFPSGEVKRGLGNIGECVKDSDHENSMMNVIHSGHTRDFLGLGGEVGLARPLLQQELAKFVSMSSAMNLLNSAAYNEFGGL